MTNTDYINMYKSEERIISDYYKIKSNNSVLDGIVTPLKIDNRQLMSPTDNQTETPHCAGFSAATLAESLLWKRTGKLKQIDSHHVYAVAKMLDHNLETEGTYLECALNGLFKLCKNDPDFGFLSNAKIGLFSNQKNDNTILETKHLLHKYDFLQVGFVIDEGWYYVTDKNYHIGKRGVQLGGHAVNLCGYDNEGVYVLNQWGTQWGSKGFAVMPWDVYLQELMYGAYIII